MFSAPSSSDLYFSLFSVSVTTGWFKDRYLSKKSIFRLLKMVVDIVPLWRQGRTEDSAKVEPEVDSEPLYSKKRFVLF